MKAQDTSQSISQSTSQSIYKVAQKPAEGGGIEFPPLFAPFFAIFAAFSDIFAAFIAIFGQKNRRNFKIRRFLGVFFGSKSGETPKSAAF